MPRRPATPVLPLRSVDVDRAFHLDFEGFRATPPCLAGVLVDGTWSATVFADVCPALVPAAEAKGLAVDTLDDFLHGLLDRAVGESRRIAAFSGREREVFRARGLDAIDGRYVDTLGLARTWRRRRHPEEAEAVARRRKRARRRGTWVGPRGNRLLDFARLASLPGSPVYGAGCTTARLRHVLGQLERRPDYGSLTAVARRKWTCLLEHNRWDCEASSALAALAVDTPERGR